MGQVQTLARSNGQTHRSYHSVRSQSVYSKRLQHQGLLTLRPVPFKNCIQIQTPMGSFFLENIQITLKDLLQSRLYTNKLFPKEDVERLIENVTYTLAFLGENGVQYKDVAAENVFYDEGGFKLLPNELIVEARYQRFLSSRMNKKHPSTHASTTSTNTQQPLSQQQQFIPISPQMIIAYRCKQPMITETDILDKSNVFNLGLLLLETCTLLPSYQCYDEETCDILDEVITERLQLVKEFYSEEIASIVANMLDYDYSERMSLKEVSIFVNRQLNKDLITNSKIVKQLSNKKPQQHRPFIDLPLTSDPTLDDNQSVVNHSHTKSAISKSRVQQTQEAATESRISRPSHNVSVSEKKRNNKTNKVYMNGGVQMEQEEEEPVVQVTKEERNRVYMKGQQGQQGQGQGQNEQKKGFINNDLQGRPLQQQQQGVLKQISNQNNIIISSSTNDSRLQQPPTSSYSKPLLSFNMRQKYTPSLPTFTQQKPSPYHNYNPNNQQDTQNRYPQQSYQPQRQMKRKNSTDYLGYRAPTNSRPPLQSNNNNNNNNNQSSFYHGKFDSLEGVNEDSGSRGYFEGLRAVKHQGKGEFRGGEDNSLSRIKSEIERSRKLIEEFKRGENVQFG